MLTREKAGEGIERAWLSSPPLSPASEFQTIFLECASFVDVHRHGAIRKEAPVSDLQALPHWKETELPGLLSVNSSDAATPEINAVPGCLKEYPHSLKITIINSMPNACYSYRYK